MTRKYCSKIFTCLWIPLHHNCRSNNLYPFHAWMKRTHLFGNISWHNSIKSKMSGSGKMILDLKFPVHSWYLNLFNNEVTLMILLTSHWVGFGKGVSVYLYFTEMHGFYRIWFRYRKGSGGLNISIIFSNINIYHSRVIKINLDLFRSDRTLEVCHLVKIGTII